MDWEETKAPAIDDTQEALVQVTDYKRHKMKRGPETKAYTHLIVAWPEDMRITPEEERDTTLRYIEGLGLEDHGYYMVSHKDKPYQHTHALIQRFPPGKERMVPAYNMHYKLWEVSRQIEEEQGRRRLPYTLTEYYQMEQERERPDYSVGPGGTLRSRLSSIEQLRGVTDRLLSADSWQDIDRLLQQEGYVMEPKRSGLVAIKKESDVAVAFSTVNPRLSHTKLAERFGEAWPDWAMRQHEQATRQRALKRELSAQGIALRSGTERQAPGGKAVYSNGEQPVSALGRDRTSQNKTVGIMATAKSGMTDERRQELLEMAANYYHVQATRLDEDSVPGKYMESRGLRGEVGREYKVGYAEDRWDGLRKAAKSRGFTDEELIESGLSYESSKGKALDRYRGRVMFPVADESGKVVGFSGRVVPGIKRYTPEPNINPKYLELGANDLYSKKSALYGEAQAIRREKAPLAVVEGYTDVTALRAQGAYAVAVAGAEGYDQQLDAIARTAQKGANSRVIVMMDGDDAGRRANARIVRGLTERGIRSNVVELRDGEDPYSLVNEQGSREQVVSALRERMVSDAEYMATRSAEGQRMEPSANDVFDAEREVAAQKQYIDAAVEASRMPAPDERQQMMREIEDLYAGKYGGQAENGGDRARYRFNQLVGEGLEQEKEKAPEKIREYYDRTIAEVEQRRQRVAGEGQVPDYALSAKDIEAGYGTGEGGDSFEDEVFNRPALSARRVGERRAEEERTAERGAFADEEAKAEGPVGSRKGAEEYAKAKETQSETADRTSESQTAQTQRAETQRAETQTAEAKTAGAEGGSVSAEEAARLQAEVQKAAVDYSRVSGESDVLLDVDADLRSAARNKSLSPTDRESMSDLRDRLKGQAEAAYTRMDESGQQLDTIANRAREAGVDVDIDNLLESVPAAEAAREGANKGVEQLLEQRTQEIDRVEAAGGDAVSMRRAWEVAGDAALDVEEGKISELREAEQGAEVWRDGATSREGATRQDVTTQKAATQGTEQTQGAEKAKEQASNQQSAPEEQDSPAQQNTSVQQDAFEQQGTAEQQDTPEEQRTSEEQRTPEGQRTPVEETKAAQETNMGQPAGREDGPAGREAEAANPPEETPTEDSSTANTVTAEANIDEQREGLRGLREKIYEQRTTERALSNAIGRIDVEATGIAGGYILSDEQERVRGSLTEERGRVQESIKETQKEVSTLESSMRQNYGEASIENVEIDRDRAATRGVNRAVEQIEGAREFETWQDTIDNDPAVQTYHLDRAFDKAVDEAERTRTEDLTFEGDRTTTDAQGSAEGVEARATAEAAALRGRDEVRPLIQAETDVAEIQGRIALQEQFRSAMMSERSKLKEIADGPREELSEAFKEEVSTKYGNWSVEGGFMANRADEFEAYGDFDSVTPIKVDSGRLAENQQWREHPTYWVVEQDGEQALVPALTAARGDDAVRPSDDYFGQKAEGPSINDGRTVEVEPIRYDLDERARAQSRLQTVEASTEQAESRLKGLRQDERRAEASLEGQRTRLERDGLKLPETVSDQRTLQDARYNGAEKEASGRGVQGRVSEEMRKEMSPTLNKIYDKYVATRSDPDATAPAQEPNTPDTKASATEVAAGASTEGTAAGAAAGAREATERSPAPMTDEQKAIQQGLGDWVEQTGPVMRDRDRMFEQHLQDYVQGARVERVFREGNAAGVVFKEDATDAVEYWKVSGKSEYLVPAPNNRGFNEVGVMSSNERLEFGVTAEEAMEDPSAIRPVEWENKGPRVRTMPQVSETETERQEQTGQESTTERTQETGALAGKGVIATGEELQSPETTPAPPPQQGEVSEQGAAAQQSGGARPISLTALQEDLQEAQRAVARSEGMAMATESVRATRTDASIAFQADERGMQYAERDSFVEESRRAQDYLDERMEGYSKQMGESVEEFWKKAEAISSQYPDQDYREVLLDEKTQAAERAAGAAVAVESINRGMDDLRQISQADQGIADGAYPQSSVREDESGLSVQVREKGIGTGQGQTQDATANKSTTQKATTQAATGQEETADARLPDPVKEPVELSREGLIANDKRMITWDERQDAIANSPYEPTGGAMADATAWGAQVERLTERLTPEDKEYLAEMNVSDPLKQANVVSQRVMEGGALPPSMQDAEVRARATGTVVDPVVEREVLTTQNTIVESRQSKEGEVTYEEFRGEASSLIEQAARGEITSRELADRIIERSEDLSAADQKWLSTKRQEVMAYEFRPENGIRTKEGVVRRFSQDDMAPSDVDSLVSRISGEEGELSRAGFARVERALDSDEAQGIGRQTQVRMERQALGRLSSEAEEQVIAERTEDDNVLSAANAGPDVAKREPAVDEATADRMRVADRTIETVEQKISAGDELSVDEYSSYRNAQMQRYEMGQITAEEGALATDQARAQLSQRNQQYASIAEDAESRLKKGLIRSATYEETMQILGEPEPVGEGPGGDKTETFRRQRETQTVGIEYEGDRITVRARGLSEAEVAAQRELMYKYDANQDSPVYREAVEIVDEMGGMGADQALNAVREGRDVRKTMAEYASAGAPATLQSSTVERGATVEQTSTAERETVQEAGNTRTEVASAEVRAQGVTAEQAGRAGVAVGAGAAATAVALGGGGGGDSPEDSQEIKEPGSTTDRRAVEGAKGPSEMPERFVRLDEMSDRAKDLRAQVTYADREVSALREDATVAKSEFEDVIRSTAVNPAEGEYAVAEFRKDWQEKGYTRAVMDEVERSMERVNTLPVEDRTGSVPDRETIERRALDVMTKQKDAAVSTAYATDLRRSYANTVEEESSKVNERERSAGGGAQSAEERGGDAARGREDAAGAVGEKRGGQEGETESTEGTQKDERLAGGNAEPATAAGRTNGPSAGEEPPSSREAEQGRAEPGGETARETAGPVRDSAPDAESRRGAEGGRPRGDNAGERGSAGLSRRDDANGSPSRGAEQGVAASTQQTGGPDDRAAGGGDTQQQRLTDAVGQTDRDSTGGRGDGRGPAQGEGVPNGDNRAARADLADGSRASRTGLDPVAYRMAAPVAETPSERVNLGAREIELNDGRREQAVATVRTEMNQAREVGRVQQAYEVSREAEARESGIKRLGQIETALGSDTESNLQRARIQFRRTMQESGVPEADTERLAEGFEEWNGRIGYRGSMYVLNQKIKELEERPVGYTGIDTNIPSQTEGMTRYAKDSIPYAATRLSAAASVAQYQEDTGRMSQRERLNKTSAEARESLSAVYRDPKEVLRAVGAVAQERTQEERAKMGPGERWTSERQREVYKGIYNEMLQDPGQFGRLKEGMPAWEAQSEIKNGGAGLALKTVDAKERYRQRLIYNERPQARDVMDMARERVEIDRSFKGLPAQDGARRELRNAYIRGMSGSELKRLNQEAEVIGRDMDRVGKAQADFGKALARQDAFSGQLDYLVAQRYEYPQEAAQRIREAYRGGLSMPGDTGGEGKQRQPSLKRDITIGEGTGAETYGPLKKEPTPPRDMSVHELDTRINKAARLTVMQERIVQRSERNLLNVTDNITDVTKAVTQVDVQVRQALNRTEAGPKTVRESGSTEQTVSTAEVGRSAVKTRDDLDIQTERVSRGTLSPEAASPTVFKSAKISRSDLMKGTATVMAPTALSVVADKRVRDRVSSLAGSAAKETMREDYDQDDFDNNKVGRRIGQKAKDGLRKAVGQNSPTRGTTGAQAPAPPQPGTTSQRPTGRGTGSGASPAESAGTGANSGASAGRDAANNAARRAAARSAGAKQAARFGTARAGAAKAGAAKTAAAKGGAGKAAALGGSGMVAATAAYKAKEMTMTSMGMEPW